VLRRVALWRNIQSWKLRPQKQNAPAAEPAAGALFRPRDWERELGPGTSEGRKSSRTEDDKSKPGLNRP
jgi:hypothetical protein